MFYNLNTISNDFEFLSLHSIRSRFQHYSSKRTREKGVFLQNIYVFDLHQYNMIMKHVISVCFSDFFLLYYYAYSYSACLLCVCVRAHEASLRILFLHVNICTKGMTNTYGTYVIDV